MNKSSAVIVGGLLAIVSPWNAVSAQAPSSPTPDTAEPFPKPPVQLRPNTGHSQFLNMLNRSMGAPKTAACREAAPYPMFQLAGPDLRSTFWADPETAGQALVVQGELMVRIGETLIEQGQAMLKKQAPGPGED